MVSRRRSVLSGAPSLAAALIAVACCATFFGCDTGAVEEEPLIRPVRYTRVAAQGESQSRTYSGAAHAELETDLSFRVAGTLIARPVNVGTVVQSGDLVAQLDGTDYQVRVDEAQAGLARAEAQLRNAEASYERTRSLYENQSASGSDLDAARAAAESALAQLRSSSQQLEAARLQLSYTRLVAPEQCTVAQAYVEVNQNLNPGQPVVRLNCGQCAEVLVSVPETDIARVGVGTEVAVAVTAVPGQTLPGVVQEVGVATSQNSSTFPVTIALQEGCASVRSGMAADVTFLFPAGGSAGGLVVPYVSVGEDRDGRFVFVLEPDADGRMFARRRPVTVGPTAETGLVITSGLNEGELVATAGVRRLSPDQEITLLNEP